VLAVVGAKQQPHVEDRHAVGMLQQPVTCRSADDAAAQSLAVKLAAGHRGDAAMRRRPSGVVPMSTIVGTCSWISNSGQVWIASMSPSGRGAACGRGSA
jgi:hypothetical protein